MECKSKYGKEKEIINANIFFLFNFLSKKLIIKHSITNDKNI